MMFRDKFSGMTAIATVLAFTQGAMAQDDFLLEEGPVKEPTPIYENEVELGLGLVTEDAFKFGEYNGLEEEGAFLIGNVSLQKRAVYDDYDTTYFVLRANNLGLESRDFRLEYGQQGRFGLFLDFNQIPKNMIDDGRTPYLLGADGSVLTLPASWVPGDRDTSEMTELAASLNDLTVEHKRQKFSGGFSLLPAKNWTVKTDFSRERKDGSRTIAGIFGSNGGNPAAVIIPEPIDYTTDTFNMAVGYSGKKGQFVVNYNLSVFDNDLRELTFDNAYASTRWPVANWPDGQGSIGLPPDNRAHSINFSGQYLVNATTRATANLSYGRMTQDQTFEDYTVNPAIVVPTALPRSSLDGEINTSLANFAITTRPNSKFNVRASYRYEDRDNKTPRDVFIVVHSDSGDQSTIDTSNARINMPYSRSQHLFSVDANYRLSKTMKLSGSYNYEEISRTFSEVSKTKEHRIESKLRFTPSQEVQGWAAVSYAMRDGSTYDDNAQYLASHTPEYLGPDPDAEFENHPLVRKFYMSDRDRFKVRGAANFMPNEKLIVGVTGRYTDDDYSETLVGLTGSTSYSVTLDGSYTASEAFSAHAWYTYDDRVLEQFGVASRPGTDLYDFSGRGWSIDTNDKTNSVGVGFTWAAIEDKLEITADATWLQAETSFDFWAGSLNSVAPLPDLTTELSSVKVRADYQWTKDITLRLRYMYQEVLIEDYGNDGVAPDTLTYVLGLGNQSPDYGVHVIGISTVYKF